MELIKQLEKREQSVEGGASPALLLIDSLNESDFDDADLIAEKLDEIKDECSVIDTVEKLRALFNELKENQPKLSDFLDPEI